MTTIDLKNKTILVTGGIGFIGANLILELLKTVSPIHIVSVDSRTDHPVYLIAQLLLIDRLILIHGGDDGRNNPF